MKKEVRTVVYDDELHMEASAAILHEKITALAAVGTVLTLAGLFLSEGRLCLKKEEKQDELAK